MRRFVVNPDVGAIFKRILESWNLAKNGKRFAKTGGRKISRVGVNHAGINHAAAPTTLYLALRRVLSVHVPGWTLPGWTIAAEASIRHISLTIRKIAVEKLRDYEAELRKLGVESISLFGSVARDEKSEASDIDVAVKLNPARAPRGFAYFGLLDDLEQRLEKVLGRRVDVVPEPAKKASMQREIDRNRIVAF